MNTTRVKPEEARSAILAALRSHGYKGRTSELAQWTGLPSSVVRRAALYLASRNQLEATLEPGRGKGEYSFVITQLDLFEDAPKLKSFWERLKGLFK